MNAEFYQLKGKYSDGSEADFGDFKGKIVLVVNIATKCGFTPQLKGLEHLYQQYRQKGLVVLGFPCDQFAHQNPEDGQKTEAFCQLHYGVRFPIMEKCDVNGSNTHPVFRYLKSRLGGFPGSRIKWNFTKFLVDRNGNPVKRFAPFVKPEAIEKALQALL